MNANEGYAQQGDGKNSEADRRKVEEQREQREQMRKDMLMQCLDHDARTRLNTIATMKPEKAKLVEQQIFARASRGMMTGKITENELIQMLDNVAKQTNATNKVIFDRRRAAIDSDDDDF